MEEREPTLQEAIDELKKAVRELVPALVPWAVMGWVIALFAAIWGLEL